MNDGSVSAFPQMRKQDRDLEESFFIWFLSSAANSKLLSGVRGRETICEASE